tara:strand:- start:536 stop:919 length:384 start_codon:yes stop_codon:yes gene_type:complete
MSEAFHQLNRTSVQQEKYDAFDSYTRKVRDLVIVQREDQHGDFKETHADIATVWNLVLKNKLKTELRSSDVALCMAALKLVRCTKPGFNQDNYDDLGAYTGITKVLKLQETGSIPPAQGHIKESNDT